MQLADASLPSGNDLFDTIKALPSSAEQQADP